MAVAPALRTFLDSLAAVDVPEIWEQPLEQARSGALLFAQAGAGPKSPVEKVSDRVVPGPAGDIPVRVYVPEGAAEPLPVVAYFHGGGWLFMGIETHDWICRRLANESGAIVVSVEYRLAPEDPFPAPLDDCHAVVTWLHAHAGEVGGDGRLAVAGDSAGGNLAAAVALRARVSGPPLDAQVLVYPVTDAGCDTPSYTENAEGYLLTARAMKWFWEQYLGEGGDPDDAFASVLRAADLSGLPPALVITAGFDPLRDEGQAYAQKLDGFDVPVEQHRYDGMIHGFLGMRELVSDADDAMQRIARFLRRTFGTE